MFLPDVNVGGMSSLGVPSVPALFILVLVGLWSEDIGREGSRLIEVDYSRIGVEFSSAGIVKATGAVGDIL